MASEPPDRQPLKLVAKSAGQVVGTFELPEAGEVVLGSSSKVECSLGTERYLSRRHVLLRPEPPRLHVERLPTASNPVLFKGVPADKFRLNPGEYFVIGSTTFHFEGPPIVAGPVLELDPHERFTLGADELRVTRDAGDRLRLLDLMQLPEILRTRSRKEFFIYACGSLRIATGARWVQVVAIEDDVPHVLCEDVGVDQLTPKPQSRSLVRQALTEAPRPVTYCWRQAGGAADLAATAYEGIDWAVCCAMPVPGEQPILFYLAGTEDGRRGHPLPATSLSLRDTARLVGLVADAIGRAVALQKLEEWQAKLGHFFSGKLVSKILESEDPSHLAPQIRRATVMFFDIRGFSLMTEGNLQRALEHQGDLKRVMTAITGCIFDHDGVVIRYMGDGILACWNVPYDLANHEERAALAALGMVELMAEATDGWHCGIGLGVGDVVAGSLGSEQVYAYDVLGAVVNQAARVEGITKEVGVPILVTGDVARGLSPDRILARRVARFLPVGVQTEVDLYTLEFAPADPAALAAVTQRHALHAQALAAFEQGQWDRAFDLLHPIVKEDPAARYVYTLALQGKPPRDWRGVIQMTTK